MKLNLTVFGFIFISFCMNGFLELSEYKEYKKAKEKFQSYSEYKGAVVQRDCHNHGNYSVKAFLPSGDKIYSTEFGYGRGSCNQLQEGQIVPLWISNVDKEIATFVRPDEMEGLTLHEFWFGWLGVLFFFGLMVFYFRIKRKNYYVLRISGLSANIERSKDLFFYQGKS